MNKSDLVREMMAENAMIGYPIISRDHIAFILGISKNYLENKLHRNCFYFEDLIAIAAIYGHKFALIDNDKNIIKTIEPEQWLEEDTIEKLYGEKDFHRKDYEYLKSKIEEMKAKYGYED